jgi:hypothetical protein
VPKLDGFFVGMGDGGVCFIQRNRVSDRTIRMAFNPADGNVLGQDWVEAGVAPP